MPGRADHGGHSHLMWRASGPNLLTFLPAALRDFPAYAAGDLQAQERILDAGFAPGSEFLWPYHHQVYWDLTQRTYREEFDPGFDGSLDAGAITLTALLTCTQAS